MPEDAPALAQPDTPPSTAQDTSSGLALDWGAGTIGGQRWQPPPGWSMATNDRIAAGRAMLQAGSQWFDTPDVAQRYGVPVGSVFDANGNFMGVFPTAQGSGLPIGDETLVYQLNPQTLQWQGIQMPGGPFGLPDWGFGALMAALVLGGGVVGGLTTGAGAAGAAATTGAEAGAAGAGAAGAAEAAAVADAAALGGVEAGGVGLEAGAGFGLGSGGILGTGITTSQVGNVLRAASLINSLYNIGTNPSGGNVGSLLGSLAGSATGIPFASTVGGYAGGQIGSAVAPQDTSGAGAGAGGYGGGSAQVNPQQLDELLLLLLLSGNPQAVAAIQQLLNQRGT